jgi:hypothetical protein
MVRGIGVTEREAAGLPPSPVYGALDEAELSAAPDEAEPSGAPDELEVIGLGAMVVGELDREDNP